MKLSLFFITLNFLIMGIGQETNNIPVNKKGHAYSIHVGTFEGAIPDSLLTTIASITNSPVFIYSERGGYKSYCVGNFKKAVASTDLHDALKAKGIKGTFLIAFYNGRLIENSTGGPDTGTP